MALPYPDDPGALLRAGTFRALDDGSLAIGEVLCEPGFTTAVHAATGDLIVATPITEPIVDGRAEVELLLSQPPGYVVERPDERGGGFEPLSFLWTITVTLRRRDGRLLPSPPRKRVLLPAGSRFVDLEWLTTVGKLDGVLVAAPSVTSVAGLDGAVTVEALRAVLAQAGVDQSATQLEDPFSRSYAAAAQAGRRAVEWAPTFTPQGSWDFAVAPTIAGRPIAGSGASGGPGGALVLDHGQAVPDGAPTEVLVVRRPDATNQQWVLEGVWDGTRVATLRTSGGGGL